MPTLGRAAARQSASVADVLEAYARRGVFRSFSRTQQSPSRAEFRFRWLLDLPFRVVWNDRAATLTFPDLLPDVEPRSLLERGLRAFVKARSSASLPDHRWIDPARLAVACSNRGGQVSLSLRVHARQYEYGVKKAVQLVNEIFLSFLSVLHPDYLSRAFHLPEE